MRIFVYVEGDSDRGALEQLLASYRQALRPGRHALRFVALGSKGAFFDRFASQAAGNLAGDGVNRVVALPDLYPNRQYVDTDNAHADLPQLAARLKTLVAHALTAHFGVRRADLERVLVRFYPCALKHDLEMLLLAAWRRLEAYIGAPLNPDTWRHPAEEQDQEHPPKEIVRRLFTAKARRGYRETRDAPAVLRRVTDLRTDLLYNAHGQEECPEFRAFLDWLGSQTGTPAY